MTGHWLIRLAVFSLALLLFVGTYSFFAPIPSADAQALSDQEKAQLQAEYDQLQTEIAQWQKVLDDTRAKKSSLQGDVTALNAQIAKAQAEIKQRNVTIATLGDQIKQKTATIQTLEQRLAQGQESLAKLLRQKNETETQSLVLLALSSQGLSEFLADVDDIDSINRDLGDLFDQIRDTRTLTQQEKDALDAKQNQELDAKHDVEVKKTVITNTQAQKKELLTETTNQEKSYQDVLAERQAQAAAIRARLFPLRDAAEIPFGTAVAYAQQAGAATGVRPALILAFLSQESDLGKNVGNCYVTDLSTGVGKGKNTGTPISNVMKAPRDTVPFQTITQALGFDWSTTPVSCPQSIGYGGAMGPAQFIPSTWQLIAARVAKALGASQANPWDAKDAIMANAILVADLGAGAQTYTAERNAACKYFSGSSCASAGRTITSYGDSVIAKATQFQQDIDFLKDN